METKESDRESGSGILWGCSDVTHLYEADLVSLAATEFNLGFSSAYKRSHLI
jgi:hypothetical protein